MTATGDALQYVRNNLIFNVTVGARSGAKKVVVVLAVGRPNQGAIPGIPAGQLKSAGVTIFALGITNSINKSELLAVATSSHHVFHMENINAVLNNGTKAFQEGELVPSTRIVPVSSIYISGARTSLIRPMRKVKTRWRPLTFSGA
jgi:hypothetical protein